MGITMIATGGVPGNRSVLLFYPEGAHLLTTCEAGGGIPPFGRAVRSARRIALSAESARQYRRACGLRSSLPVRLADGCRLICIFAANRCPCLGTTCHPPATNLPPAALSQRWTMPSRTVHFLLLAPKETKTPPCGEQKGRDPLWRSIIWKLRS